MASRGPREFLPSFSLLYFRVLVCNLDKVLRGICVHKRLGRRVVSGDVEPGGIGGPAARPNPCRSCLRVASIFLSIQETYVRKIFAKTVAFLGTFGGSLRSSPRGRLGFAEGKAKSTSVFVCVQAPEGSDDSQNINK